MRAALSLLILLLFFVPVCSSEINYTTASQASDTWFSLITDSLRTVSLLNSITIERDSVAVLHVFNYSDGGYVVMPTDNNVPPALAYSESGLLDSTAVEDPDSPIKDYLDWYADQIAVVKADSIENLSAQDQWQELLTMGGPTRDTVVIEIEEYMPTFQHWAKEFLPLMPDDVPNPGPSDWDRSSIGCPAISASTIINHHRFVAPDIQFDDNDDYTMNIPDSWYDNLTELNGLEWPPPDGIDIDDDLGDTTYGVAMDWATYSEVNSALDTLLYLYDNETSIFTTGYEDVVRGLLFAVGINCSMMYTPMTSGAYTGSFNWDKFGYTSEWVNYLNDQDWIDMMTGEVDEGRLVQYAGQYPSGSEGSGGHSFVLQGYEHLEWNSTNPVQNYRFYFHFGWEDDEFGQTQDGFYYLNNIVTPSGGNYTASQSAVINLQPAECILAGGGYHIHDGDTLSVCGLVPVNITALGGLEWNLETRNSAFKWYMFDGEVQDNQSITIRYGHDASLPDPEDGNFFINEETYVLDTDSEFRITIPRGRVYRKTNYQCRISPKMEDVDDLRISIIDQSGELDTIEGEPWFNNEISGTLTLCWVRVPEEYVDKELTFVYDRIGYHPLQFEDVHYSGAYAFHNFLYPPEEDMDMIFTAIEPSSHTYPTDFPNCTTLQSAIDTLTVQPFDTLYVEPGTYGPVSITKSLVLSGTYSQTLDPEDILDTVIEGGEYTSAITIGEEIDVVVTGLTVTNDSGENYGINASSAHPLSKLLVEHCLVIGNRTGISTDYGTIDQCTIIDNAGAGINAHDAGITVKSCIIRDNTGGVITGDEGTPIEYSNCDDEVDGVWNIDVDPAYVDESTGDYRLEWSGDLRSPCIDVGNPYDSDPDGTYADMSACPVEMTHSSYRTKSPQGNIDRGWKWLSYPVTDTYTTEAPNDMDTIGNVLLPLLDPDTLECCYWKEPGEEPSVLWYNPDTSEWENTGHVVQRNYGYKVRVQEEFIYGFPMVYSGFEIRPDSLVILKGDEEENWIGYYPRVTAAVQDAFQAVWDDLTMIKHQDWCLVQEEGEWIGDIEKPTLSWGDMVIVTCRDSLSFVWNQAQQSREYLAPEAEYFTFEEKADYVPFFVELEEGVQPLEVAVTVGDSCMGAAPVVDSDLVQINGYVLDDEGEMLEGEYSFDLYYGERAEPVRVRDYLVSDNRVTIDPDAPQAWYRIKLGEGAVPPPQKITLSAYPNPFNPETTICWSIPQDSGVKLAIYNVRGQRIRTLVDGFRTAGSHSVVWDGTTDTGTHLSSGIYFYRLQSGGRSLTRKCLLLK